MRVSLVNAHLIPTDAIAQCVLAQARYFLRRGADVRIFAMYPPPYVPDDVASIVQLAEPDEFANGKCEHLNRSDLRIFQYPGLYGLLDGLRPYHSGVTVLYYQNVTPPDLWGQDGETDLLARSVAAVGELVRRVDWVITPSSFNLQNLVEQHGCPPTKVQVLPMPVDLDRFHPGPPDEDIVRKHNLGGFRIILYVGRMAPNKRVDLLVEALPQIRRTVPNALLLLVGDTESSPAFTDAVAAIRKRASTLGVYSAVRITGLVDDVAPYYGVADAYATASLHEGFGVPLIEAMAAGVPVVASNATAHPWVVGDAGLLVEPGNANALAAGLVTVLTSNHVRELLTKRGLERARSFSIQNYESALDDIVRRMIA